jgi:[calcium/calmodulin-dependent protein kinase] kinase
MCKDRSSESLYAIKIISKDFLRKKKSTNNGETYFEDIRREIAIMKKLLHPNVLQLFEVLDDPKVNKLYLVLEYMKRGDLYKVLQDRLRVTTQAYESSVPQSSPENIESTIAASSKVLLKNKENSGSNLNHRFPSLQNTYFTEYEIWNVFRQVCAGLRYLHQQNVIHGDIKPQVLFLLHSYCYQLILLLIFAESTGIR